MWQWLEAMEISHWGGGHLSDSDSCHPSLAGSRISWYNTYLGLTDIFVMFVHIRLSPLVWCCRDIVTLRWPNYMGKVPLTSVKKADRATEWVKRIERDQSMDWSPEMQVKTEVGYKAQSYCRVGSRNGTGYLIQCSRPIGHIMRDQQIIWEANATEDGSKCQRWRGQLRQQTNLMGRTNMREKEWIKYGRDAEWVGLSDAVRGTPPASPSASTSCSWFAPWCYIYHSWPAIASDPLMSPSPV